MNKKNKQNDKHMQEVERLAKAIDKVEDEKLLIENQLKKALADYSNLERDLDKRIEMRGDQMKIEIARTLLSVLDDIEMAIQASADIEFGESALAWVEGVKVTLSNIEKVINEFGIEKMNIAVGDSFDSSVHEAIGTVQEGEKGKIHQVVQPGFILSDIVIRPARVIVQQGK